MPSSRKLAEKAKKIRNKKAPYGPDIDLSLYSSQAKEHQPMELKSLTKSEEKLLTLTGIDVLNENRSGTFTQIDHSVLCSMASQKGI